MRQRILQIYMYHPGLRKKHFLQKFVPNRCCLSTSNAEDASPRTVTIAGSVYDRDEWTNIRPGVVSKIGRNLHRQQHHPLNLIRLRIQNYFYTNFISRTGSPLFAVFDNINPVVSTYQNFDSLLVPQEHISRTPSDSYYINKYTMLRAHTSAHQEELIKMGFDAFLVVGDVYRRDEIDSTHFPVFHQMEGVRLYTETEVISIF